MQILYKLTGVLQYVFLIVVIIMIIYYVLFHNSFEDLYNKLEGEDPRYAQEALDLPVEKKDAEYYYKRGVILQHNLHDIEGATRNYETALRLLNEDQNNIDHIFITDRIGDHARVVNNIGLQINADDTMARNMIIVPEPFANTNDRVNIIGDAARVYKSDSQNVHDSTLNVGLLEQFNKLRQYNTEEGINYSVETIKPANNRIAHVINVIKSNPSHVSLINGTEYELLQAVWTRIHSASNRKNYDNLKDSLNTQLEECATSDNATVCVAGRCSHVLSSLALLDADESMGILRTKELTRNELLNDAAQIMEKCTGAIDKHTLNDYNNSNETTNVLQLKAKISEKINGLRDKYTGVLPPTQLDLLIEQCLAVV